MKKKQNNNLLVQTLKQINEDAWCQRTYWKAEKNFQFIQDKLTKEEAAELQYRLSLDFNPDNPDFNNDYYDKANSSEYIKELIKKYENEVE